MTERDNAPLHEPVPACNPPLADRARHAELEVRSGRVRVLL